MFNISALRSQHPRVFSGALLLCLTAVLALPAGAQITDHSWELGFALGNANLSSSSEDFDLDFRTDVRGGYFFSDLFELEGQLILADARFDAQLTATMANAVFNFRSDQAIVPYALAGVGISEIEDIRFLDFLGLGPERSEDSFAYQVGVGSRFFVGPERRMAVRVELSNLWLDTDLFDNDRHTSFTAGLSWTLGNR